MQIKRNIIEESKAVVVEEKYDICTEDIQEIVEACKGETFSLISIAFKIGYMQGQKAERGRK